MDSFLKALSSVLRYITPLKTFLLILIIFSSIAATVIWENRQLYFNNVTGNLGLPNGYQSASLVLSPKSKNSFDNLVISRKSFILAGSAIGIDVALNRRNIVYRYFNDKEIEVKVRTADINNGSDLPLFGSNEAQNKQVLSLLQGEFSCSKIITTGINTRYGADIADSAVATCRVPIPPAYGHLIGYIVFHLSREPTEEELNELRIDAYTLSMNIYNEILRNSGPVKRID